MELVTAETLGELAFWPSGLTRERLEVAIGRRLGETVSIQGCSARNLCAQRWGRVSNSGSTVVRLSLAIERGVLDVVVKVLCPDAVNLFKIDRMFDSRASEVELMRWWGGQDVPFVPVVYDAEVDQARRSFWVVMESFPRVGLGHEVRGDEKRMVDQGGEVEELMRETARLHAYTFGKRGELMGLCPGRAGAIRRTGSSEELAEGIERGLADGRVMALLGLSETERSLLGDCARRLRGRPGWSEGGDGVCVNCDIGFDNLAERWSEAGRRLVFVDWGIAHLGAMEEEFRVVLPRLAGVSTERVDELLGCYTREYARLTGRAVEVALLRRRIPWGGLRVTIGYVLDHLEALRWVPWQSRSAFLIHRLLEEARGHLGRLAR
ncbi:MAG: phosphotransferase [Phycisphaeraceae bacterium]|nr:phosphotransferase [Phycisphaeraceae bacterium]